MSGLHIVITGNPVDGYEHFGPFDSAEAAMDWVESSVDSDLWWITELTSPEGAGVAG